MLEDLNNNYPKDQNSYVPNFKYKLVDNDVDSQLALVYN